ncbi:MAG: hypothetical protein A2W95_14355 [Bacteroidetes bacterium GWA2_40_14]|nr:MAG: hypothetical protein A2W95_14355 [Bacteroidetes bacterium GWA2_40_14]
MKFQVIFTTILLFSAQIFSQEMVSITSKVDKNTIYHQLANKNQSENTPFHYGTYRPKGQIKGAKAVIKGAVFIEVAPEIAKELNVSQLTDNIMVVTNIGYEKKKPMVEYTFNPFRKNPLTDNIEMVTEYTLQFELTTQSLKKSATHIYSNNSKLSTGFWYKVKVDTTGIFKLTYSQIKQFGLTEPQNVRVFSHGGKQLPYMNNVENYDDLVEIPISMHQGNDNVFNEGDYILFYTQGPTTWNYDEILGMFIQHRHNYSNFTYLFLTSDLGAGERLTTVDENGLVSNSSTTSFDSYRFHELEKFNLIRSGRTWYGEMFRSGSSSSFSFDFPNINSGEKVKVYTNVAGRRESSAPYCHFKISENNILAHTIDITGNQGEYLYANEYSGYFEITEPSQNINLTFNFTGGNSSSEGYLNYISLNARENLNFTGSPILFRDAKNTGANNITQFKIQNNGFDIEIWDVSDPVSYKKMAVTNANGFTQFITKTDSLKEFVAFTHDQIFIPIVEGTDVGQVENQNLHGIGAQDMVIVTNPKFLSHAEELAQWHRDQDHFRVYVTIPDKIYNEFSSGCPDVAAIRNFMRMLYEKATVEGDLPKYLLLFGDGSYDNMTQSSANSNLIPTYQSINSLVETASYVSDDFFGLLDFSEGEYLGKMDLGIGRFPVQTEEEAQLMLDKIYHFTAPETSGDWVSKICFIGDDGDSGTHITQPESIANYINNSHPEYNVNKIYLDAYHQISTPSGQRFPDVTNVINEQVTQGALIIDYVGHGNPRILTHEEVLSSSDVRSWTNWNKLSVFVTASCEVGRFDDYERTSLGEWMVLNPNGGGVAAFTTTRVVYSGGNHDLNTNFFEAVFNTDYRLGDVIRVAKANTSGDTNKRNFSLLGDPALKLPVPKNKILKNPLLNDQDSSVLDTLNALEKTTISGYIHDENGNYLTENGVVYITVYDKKDTLNTYGQDNSSIKFTLQDKILFRGKVSVTNGYFQSEFIIPKDINFKYGRGKISLFAMLDSNDAIGYAQDIIIGGNAKSTSVDEIGPEIHLFMNDTTFMNGGTTDQNPILLARLIDEYGINTTGNGFGHNMVVVLDNDQDNVLLLNNYYEGGIDQYNQGTVVYPMKNLIEGIHTLYFKTWDIYNNSSEASLEFYVKNNQEAIIENLYNYPNPFNDETYFVFNHNMASQELTITIDIYDLMGQQVSQLKQTITPDGYQVAPILWQGTNFGGAKIPNGIYIYKVQVSNKEGVQSTKSSKLMIFR